ncbi:energy-coupling factor transporter transmembrane component T [Heyndrickxia camelliae]|uniref:Energy-coupling factor transporter transmembrane protein EcfT n=1 Tax=Heyndrickxia camelliae TaxID=1707093 RepID=A0A2N3LH55_9BACI|nr:energy-coupling factor transporter transmembrane component T [Heyndrickxia camelliae]PKR83951.1 energy-coupling factor transporter transmembrane protein EcfT [Heyndrickxia camelliae]
MNRGFRSFHPFVSFFYYVGAAALVMLNKHPVFLFIGGIILICFNIALDRGKTLKKWWRTLVILSLFFLIVNPLINHRGTHILFYFGQNPIMLEAIIQGIILALSLFCLMVLFSSYNLVITADKFLYLFSKWLPQWALLTMISMRFVPLLRRRLKEIQTVQRGKGLSVNSGTMKERAKNGIQLVQILLTWSLEEALQTADSMAGRGYGLRKRSRYIPFKMKRKDWLAIIYMAIVGSISIFGWWLGDGVLSINPILEPIFLEGREWFYLFIFILFLGFPLGIEEREALRWHYWKRKI